MDKIINNQKYKDRYLINEMKKFLVDNHMLPTRHRNMADFLLQAAFYTLDDLGRTNKVYFLKEEYDAREYYKFIAERYIVLYSIQYLDSIVNEDYRSNLNREIRRFILNTVGKLKYSKERRSRMLDDINFYMNEYIPEKNRAYNNEYIIISINNYILLKDDSLTLSDIIYLSFIVKGLVYYMIETKNFSSYTDILDHYGLNTTDIIFKLLTCLAFNDITNFRKIYMDKTLDKNDAYKEGNYILDIIVTTVMDNEDLAFNITKLEEE